MLDSLKSFKKLTYSRQTYSENSNEPFIVKWLSHQVKIRYIYLVFEKKKLLTIYWELVYIYWIYPQ